MSDGISLVSSHHPWWNPDRAPRNMYNVLRRMRRAKPRKKISNNTLGQASFERVLRDAMTNQMDNDDTYALSRHVLHRMIAGYTASGMPGLNAPITNACINSPKNGQ